MASYARGFDDALATARAVLRSADNRAEAALVLDRLLDRRRQRRLSEPDAGVDRPRRP